MARRQYRSAFFFFQQALQKQPDFRPALEGVAAVYRASNHADWAAKQESRLKAPDCTVNKPECDFRAGRFQTVSVSSTPYWRVRAYNELARQSYARLAGLPESVDVHAIKAEIAASQGQHLEAANEWRAAQKLAPNDPNLQLPLAAELHDAGDYQNALAILTKVARKDPGVEFLIGDSLLRSEQPEEAIPHLRIAVRGAPQMVPAQAALGLAYMRTGKPAEAVPHLASALEADDDGSLHYQLARAHQAAGNAEKSKQAMAQYQEILKRNEVEKRDLEDKAQITAP